MIKYRPIEYAGRLAAPILIIDVENEELFDIRAHGGLVYQRVDGKIPAKYHVFPGLKHYDIYTRAREEAIGMAVDWYDKYLKGDRKD
jgi:dipeptidyl aminopeptidase/acylaminoacyl peptidase